MNDKNESDALQNLARRIGALVPYCPHGEIETGISALHFTALYE